MHLKSIVIALRHNWGLSIGGLAVLCVGCGTVYNTENNFLEKHDSPFQGSRTDAIVTSMGIPDNSWPTLIAHDGGLWIMEIDDLPISIHIADPKITKELIPPIQLCFYTLQLPPGKHRILFAMRTWQEAGNMLQSVTLDFVPGKHYVATPGRSENSLIDSLSGKKPQFEWVPKILEIGSGQ